MNDLAQKIADAVYEAIKDEINGYAWEYAGAPEKCIEDSRKDILEAVKAALAKENA